MICLDLDYCDDDIYSDPMNGQREQGYYFYGYGPHLLWCQLVFVRRQEVAMWVEDKKRLIGIGG